MNIRKVAVLGAGAVGSYVIWRLSARADIELGVVEEKNDGRFDYSGPDQEMTWAR